MGGCPEGDSMRVSGQNQLIGVIESVKSCAVMCEVVLRTDAGVRVVAIVTTDSVEHFDLRPGKRVAAGFKTADTLIGVP